MVILLVCALFLIGVVIGYCISQASQSRRLDGSCQQAQQRTSDKDTSSQSLELSNDARQIKQRHWNLVSQLQAADYSLPDDLMYDNHFTFSLYAVLLI